MGTVRHAELTCSRCGTDTVHEVVYAGRLLAEVTCTACGRTYGRDVRADYLADLRQRLVSKPKRMLRRLRKDPLRFASSLPKTVPAKPLELLSEIRVVWHSGKNRRPRGGH
ncbi:MULTISPECIES: hypothetical protein [Amycolatopsis]|uniref:Bh protein n=1 Tax=Amycolatopsis tucumanensis TaxID=401106 RepID=A0ABP7J9I6_9PSEU|nr:hypothetical protein [Amycolatopsis tucumanensis]MCF6427546.1 hypothetical protein [Amycolatopsis tucumanensis]